MPPNPSERNLDSLQVAAGLDLASDKRFKDMAARKEYNLNILSIVTDEDREVVTRTIASMREDLNKVIGEGYIDRPANLIASSGFITDEMNNMIELIDQGFVMSSANTTFNGANIITVNNDKYVVVLQFTYTNPEGETVRYGILPYSKFELDIYPAAPNTSKVWHTPPHEPRERFARLTQKRIFHRFESG